MLDGSQAGSHATAAVVLLRCPRCGLEITPRAMWLTVEHCPRCIARARLAVTLDYAAARQLAEPDRGGPPPLGA